MSDKDMVTFLMPDGTEVSNDPAFGLQEALQAVEDSQEYTGDAGIHPDDQKAQTQVEHMASLQSGQPGVGPNATVDDPTKDLHGVLGSPAQQIQKDDMAKAKEDGASPMETSIEDAEPVDSNEAVLQERARRQALRDKAMEALEKAGEDPGDPDKPYSEWTAKQLKAEVARRNADGRSEEDSLELQQGMKKADVATMLDDDDARLNQS